MDIKKISEKQKKAYKLNIIDFLLIGVIIVAVSVLIYVMLGNNLLTGGEETTILYTIEIPLIKNEYIASIFAEQHRMKGTKIIESVRSYDIGEIQEIKITDAYSNTTDLETGVVNSKPYPDHSKVSITVKAKCKIENEIKFVINGKTIMVGIKIDFRTPYLVSYGTCVYIEELNEAGEVINTYGEQ